MPAYPGASIQKQRNHHARLKRRTTPPVLPIGGIKRRQIELLNDIEQIPRQMPPRQPVAHARRQQEVLLAIARQEVLRHPASLLNRSDRTGLTQQPLSEIKSQRIAES